jgi:hypothetical protein
VKDKASTSCSAQWAAKCGFDRARWEYTRLRPGRLRPAWSVLAWAHPPGRSRSVGPPVRCRRALQFSTWPPGAAGPEVTAPTLSQRRARRHGHLGRATPAPGQSGPSFASVAAAFPGSPAPERSRRPRLKTRRPARRRGPGADSERRWHAPELRLARLGASPKPQVPGGLGGAWALPGRPDVGRTATE